MLTRPARDGISLLHGRWGDRLASLHAFVLQASFVRVARAVGFGSGHFVKVRERVCSEFVGSYEVVRSIKAKAALEGLCFGYVAMKATVTSEIEKKEGCVGFCYRVLSDEGPRLVCFLGSSVKRFPVQSETFPRISVCLMSGPVASCDFAHPLEGRIRKRFASCYFRSIQRIACPQKL